jgi:hypothetical protein
VKHFEAEDKEPCDQGRSLDLFSGLMGSHWNSLIILHSDYGQLMQLGYEILQQEKITSSYYLLWVESLCPLKVHVET